MSEVLVLDRVCKTFGKRAVVRDVSFSVKEGEVFGFLGPNGAGKTTTIKMILGLLSPDSGTILVDGHNVETEFEAAMKNLSGIVENPDMYPYLSGYDNLMIQARACGVGAQQVDEAVQMVGMQMRIREKFKTYSLGMKQRLGIAQALLHQPKIMILDEPTNGLDPAGIQEMRNLLRHLAHNAGVSVLVSSHILQEMQLMCDTVGIISNGALLQVADVGGAYQPQQEQYLPLYSAALRPGGGAAAHVSSRPDIGDHGRSRGSADHGGGDRHRQPAADGERCGDSGAGSGGAVAGAELYGADGGRERHWVS